MEPSEIFRIILLILLIVCAVGAALSKKLLTTVIIFMSYSGIMAIVWALMQSPDLAVTEAAVGAGVSSVLFFMCLRRLGQTDRKKAEANTSGEDEGEDAGEVESEEEKDAVGGEGRK